MMNVTEKSKVKRVEVLAALEKKVARRLRSGQIDEAIEELHDIIDDYRRLGINSKADVLEMTLNEVISELSPKTPPIEVVHSPQKEELPVEVQILEARASKAIRRFLQGKDDEAVTEILEIIESFRQQNEEERAKALEEWMLQFLDKKLDYDREQTPLVELLDVDPDLQNQLLSYRYQQVLKKFIQGKPRKGVEEFVEIVNDYKCQGRLDIVETLEVWFNLFITKTYLLPSQKPIPTSTSTAPRPPNKYWQPPIKLPQPPPNHPKPPTTSSTGSIAPQQPASTPLFNKEDVSAPPTDRFKEKINKIKSLLKDFEESLD